MIDFEITKVGGMASSNSQPVLERKVSHSPSPLRNQVPATQRGYVDRLKAHSSEGSTRNNNCVAFDVKKPSHQTFVNSKSQESNDSATMEPKLLKEKNGIINSLIKTNKETLSESPIKLGEVKLENDDLKTKTENKNFVNSETKELEKVMENVNKDLSITKDWKLKNSKQRTCNDPLAEDNIKTVLNKEEKNEESSECSVVKDVNTSSDNSSNSTMHLNNSSSCKNSLLNERTVKSQKTSPLPHSSDELNELDDMSIDLTEEEEEALLGKNEPTDMDTDLDLQVDVGSANLADENDTKEIDISQQEWQIVDEVDASSPEDASEKNPSADISSSSRIDDQLSPNKTTNDKTETKEGHDEDIEFSSSQDTQLAPEDSPESKFSSPSLSQGSQNDEKTLTEDCDKISSNGIENKTLNHDQGALNTMEDVDLPPVPDNAPKGENLLWNFKKVSANPTSEILKDLQFFDNTAKEEGLQKEVDRVVQKILTDIPPDGDSDDTVTIVDDKNVSSPVVLKSLNDKQIFNTEMISDKWASSIQNSPVKHPVATDSQLYNNDSNKTPKREILLNQDENIKPDPSSPNYPGTSPVKTLPSVDDDKQDTDMKRKWKNPSEDGKPSELSGLTVKKVKLDTDTVREEMVALKSKLTTRTEPLKVKSETVARKLTQSELEDIIARRMSLYLTENERNEIGSLKSKCEHLEKSLEIWKRRANLAQKQTVELQIALQRIAHQNVRKTGTAPIVKLSTRSVGLQVQMHSFLVPEGKIAPRGGPITSGNSTIKMIPASNSAVQPVLPPKMPISSTMTSLHLSQSGRPILPNTTTATSIHTVNTMTTKAANNMPVTKTLGTHAGVSILQPRITNSQPTTNSLVMNTVSSASPSGSIPKVANVVTPAPPTVRNLLDSRRIQVDENEQDGSQENVNPLMSESDKLMQKSDEKEKNIENENPLTDQASSGDSSSAYPVSKVESTTKISSKLNRVFTKKELPLGSDVQQNSHTQSMTRAALRILRRFLSNFRENREINELSPADLDKYLSSFFSDAKKKDGTDYGPHTLTCIFDSIDRFLRVCCYPVSIKKDDIFYTTRENLRTKRKQLRKLIAAKKKKSLPFQQQSSSSSTKPEDSINPLKSTTVSSHHHVFPENKTPLTAADNSFGNALPQSKDTVSVEYQNASPKQDLQLEAILSKYFHSESGIEIIKLDSSKHVSNEPMLGNEADLQNNRVINGANNEQNKSVYLDENISNSNLKTDASNTLENVQNHSRSSWTYRIPHTVSVFLQWMQNSVQNDFQPLHDIPATVLDTYIAAYMDTYKNIYNNNSSLWAVVKTFWDDLYSYLGYFNYFCSLNVECEFPKTMAYMNSLKGAMTNGKNYPKTSATDRCEYNQYSELSLQIDNQILADVQVFMAWLSSFPINDNRQIFLISPPDLDNYLAKFFTHLKKEDDSAISANEFSRIFNSIDKYLIFYNYQASIKLDECFRMSYECFSRRHRTLLENESSSSTQQELLPIDASESSPKKFKSEDCKNYTFDKDESCSNFPTNSYKCNENKTEGYASQFEESSSNGSDEINDQPNTCSSEDACKETEDSTLMLKEEDFQDNEGSCFLASLLEPDISLIEDEDEIVLTSSDLKLNEKDENCHPIEQLTYNACDIRPFQEFLSKHLLRDNNEVQNIPPPKLNQFLAQFYLTFEASSSYGLDYLLSFPNNLQDYLTQHGYSGSILTDPEFNYSRLCSSFKLKTLQANENFTQSSNDLTEFSSGLALLQSSKILGSFCPISLLCTLFYHMTEKFGIDTSEKHANICWGDIELIVEYEQEFLEYTGKITDPSGSNVHTSRIISEPNNECCPISAYKKYQSTRPPNTLKPLCKFYLCMSPTPGSDIWFSDIEMDKENIEALQSYIKDVLLSLKLTLADSDREALYAALMGKLINTSVGPNLEKNAKLDTETTSVLAVENKTEVNSVAEIKITSSDKIENLECFDKNSYPDINESKLKQPKYSNTVDNVQQNFIPNTYNVSQSSTRSEIKNTIREVTEMVRNKSVADEKLKEAFAAEGHAPNTIIKTLHDVNVFKEWLNSKNESREISSIPPTELGVHLLQFFTNLKKRDGTDYEPNSLYSIYFSIDRYLKVKKYSGNIKTDASFQDCRKLFQERRREFDAERLRDAVHVRRQVDFSFSDEDIQLLREHHLLGPWNPEAMLLALWYTNTLLLGIHSQKAHLHMLWGDIELQTTLDGKEFLEYHQQATKAKLASSSNNGVLSFIPIAKKPSKVYATPNKPTECPVELFKLYRLRRPMYTLTIDSRFYLCPNQDSQSAVWFRSIPMGRNRLACIPATIWNLIKKVKGAAGNIDSTIQPSEKMSFASADSAVDIKSVGTSYRNIEPHRVSVAVPSSNAAAFSSSTSTIVQAKENPSISLIPIFTKPPNESKQENDATVSVATQEGGSSGTVINLPTCFPKPVHPLPAQNIVLFPLTSSCNSSSISNTIVSAAATNVVQIIPLLATPTCQTVMTSQEAQICPVSPYNKLSNYSVSK